MSLLRCGSSKFSRNSHNFESGKDKSTDCSQALTKSLESMSTHAQQVAGKVTTQIKKGSTPVQHYKH